VKDARGNSLCESCTTPSPECRSGMEVDNLNEVREDRTETAV
jgi:hypothetical protein